MKPWQKAAGSAAALITAGTLAFVTKWEGEGPKNAEGEYSVYLDIVSVPTVCAGITGPAATPGKTYTKEECDSMLKRELIAHGNGLLNCINVSLSHGEFDALSSWTYNVGVNAACKSTLVKKLNAGDRQGACLELLKWNRAGGREVAGLTNRRRDEYKLCVRDL